MTSLSFLDCIYSLSGLVLLEQCFLLFASNEHLDFIIIQLLLTNVILLSESKR